MPRDLKKRAVIPSGYKYQSPGIPRSAIRRFAKQLGERFRPDRIILFGSYAYGAPNDASDVDLLVVMPTKSEVNQAIRMTLEFEPPFPLDLIVRTPAKIKRRLAEGSLFLEEIITQGIVVYEEGNRSLGEKGGSRPGRRRRSGGLSPTVQ